MGTPPHLHRHKASGGTDGLFKSPYMRQYIGMADCRKLAVNFP